MQAQDRCVFFDLDGTLLDSQPGIVECLNRTITELGRAPCGTDELASHIGSPLGEVLAELLGSQDESLVAAAVTIYRNWYAQVGIEQSLPFAGIPNALTALQKLGCRLYVVTAKLESVAEEAVQGQGLDGFFERVYGSREDGKLAVKDDLIRHVLRTEHLASDAALMVGDRHHDLLGAKANRMLSVAVTWGYGSRHELAECNPEFSCDAPLELPGSIESWCRRK